MEEAVCARALRIKELGSMAKGERSSVAETCCEMSLTRLVDPGIQGKSMDLIPIAWKMVESL